MIAVTVEFEPLGVGQHRPGLKAQQRVMMPGLIRGDVVAVVGRHRAQFELRGQVQQLAADVALHLDAVVHDLDEEAVGAEDVFVVRGGLQRLLLLAEPKPSQDLTGQAPARRDDPLGVLGEQFLVHARLAEKALHGRQRRQLEQVAQPGRVLGEHGHVGVGTRARDVAALAVLVYLPLPGPSSLTPEHRLLVEPALRSEVRLNADDRLDTGLLGVRVEAVRAEHVAVVGHGHSGLFEPGDLGEQRVVLGSTVEHRELSVHVQVNEPIRHAVISGSIR